MPELPNGCWTIDLLTGKDLLPSCLTKHAQKISSRAVYRINFYATSTNYSGNSKTTFSDDSSATRSLDSVARVGRLSFQEFFLDADVDEENMSPFLKFVTNKYFATIITLVLAYLLTKVGYAEIWPLFGSANQLLSVLALVACAVFLKKTKRQGFMLWGPMVFMMAVTFTALGMTIVKLSKAFMTTGLDLGNSLQLIFAVLLLILGVLVAIQGIKKLLERR